MAIKNVTNLDFEEVKQNLKTHLQSQEEFSDYNFDASGLSVLVDLLAYNTHYNAVMAHMIANESFIDSAVKRNSVVSIAKTMGYTPRSARSAKAYIDLTITPDPTYTSNTLFIPRSTIFTTSVNGKSYSFLPSTDRTITKSFTSSGAEQFVTTGIELVEGRRTTTSEIISANNLQGPILLPNNNVDTTTIQVTVKENTNSSVTDTYAFSDTILDVTSTSKVFYIEEATSGFYEVSFGDCVLGKKLEIGNIVKKFFDENWIHAPVLEGKSPGAFAASTVASAHPFIHVNFQGKTRDVSTLAHELGHGVHQYLAGKNQTHFNASTPLTLAETASVFGEMLTFKSILEQANSKKERKALLANKVEDMLNTVIRQIAFFQFEKEVHTLRQQTELSIDQICKIWMNVQKASLGPSIKYEEEYKYFWSYIPHFIHSPFYVYAYAFGDCLVNSLFNTYEKGLANFDDKYIDLLKSGGSKKYNELFSPFNLNLSKKSFWKKGLNVIESFIDELETL